MTAQGKNISLEEILTGYNRIKDRDAEPDLRNKFRALLYYHTKDGAISDTTLLEVANATQSEFVCLLLARKNLVCFNNTEIEREDIISCTSLDCTEKKTTVTTKDLCNGPCAKYRFTDLLLDNEDAKIKSKDDLIKAIQSFSQRVLSRYNFTEADVDLLPIAIEHYNSLAISKLLPFVRSAYTPIKIPNLQEFPRLQQEMSKFKRDTVWFSQLSQVQEENNRRLSYWKTKGW